MTLAICIHCGHKKLGALTPCTKCGFQPNAALDQAKSISLSDHNLSREELVMTAKKIESGEAISFDDVALSDIAESVSGSGPKYILGARRSSWIALGIAVFLGLLGGSCFYGLFHLFPGLDGNMGWVALVLISVGVVAFVADGIVKARRDRKFVREAVCPKCGCAYGEEGVATRRQIPVLGPIQWSVRCTRCGETSEVGDFSGGPWI